MSHLLRPVALTLAGGALLLALAGAVGCALARDPLGAVFCGCVAVLAAALLREHGVAL